MSPSPSTRRKEQHGRERREQILDAAIEIFGQKGFEGARVSEIASAAKVAVGTVYLYFQSKEEMFKAVLIERSFLPHLADLLVENQPLEVTLRKVAESYFSFFDENLPIFRVAITDAYRFPDLAHQVYRDNILRGNRMLANYLGQQIEAGVVRPLVNPLLTARAFMGLLNTHVLLQEHLGGKTVAPIEREDWIRETLYIFIQGIVKKHEVGGS